MVNLELETSIETLNSTESEIARHRLPERQKIRTDIQHEIECPRCSDIMILLSDFDSLYYSCEECGFILYAMKKGLG